MLTKDFQRTYVPAVPGSPAVPYRAAYTVCQQSPAPGRWEYQCKRIEINTSVIQAIPPGGTVAVVYDPSGAIDPLTGKVKVIDIYIRVCTSTWIATGEIGPKVCTTYPAQLHVPAVTHVPARVDVTPIHAWDAGANSVTSQSGDCECAFTMQLVAGAVVGFTSIPETVPAVARMSHALSFSGRKFQVMEAGAGRTNAHTFADGDSFQIRRHGGTVSYLHNGVVVYTSKVPSSGEIWVGCSLYSSGDYIE